uniref:UNC93-like protein MFSD11 n=1 Tax=Caenorhabditis tropicalis TaxID=1561998 RepID=A0A1I7TMX7_9PELO
MHINSDFAICIEPYSQKSIIQVAVLRKKAQTAPETGITTNSGYYSLSIIYFFFTFFNLVIPSIVKQLGAKWSQIIGASGYLFFMLTFLYLNVYLLYFGSAVLGAGAALLWAGNGCYLVEVSRRNKMERNSGIMWAMLQSSLITGGIFLIYVLRSGDLSDSFTFIYMVFSSVIALGIVILIFMPSNPAQYGQQNEDPSGEEPLIPAEPDDSQPIPSFNEQLKSMISLFFTPNMMCLAVLFVYSGLEMTFYTGVYTSCLSATIPLKNFSDLVIPYNALLIGAGQIIGGVVTGPLGKVLRIRTQHIIFLAFAGHLTAFILTYLSLPYDSTVHSTDAATILAPSLNLTLLISFLLGVSDAFWQTQIYVTIGLVFKDDPVNAFAIFKFFQSMAACVSFFYSSFLFLPSQLLILTIGCVASTLFFLKVKLAIHVTNVEAVREREI